MFRPFLITGFDKISILSETVQVRGFRVSTGTSGLQPGTTPNTATYRARWDRAPSAHPTHALALSNLRSSGGSWIDVPRKPHLPWARTSRSPASGDRLASCHRPTDRSIHNQRQGWHTRTAFATRTYRRPADDCTPRSGPTAARATAARATAAQAAAAPHARALVFQTAPSLLLSLLRATASSASEAREGPRGRTRGTGATAGRRCRSSRRARAELAPRSRRDPPHLKVYCSDDGRALVVGCERRAAAQVASSDGDDLALVGRVHRLGGHSRESQVVLLVHLC